MFDFESKNRRMWRHNVTSRLLSVVHIFVNITATFPQEIFFLTYKVHALLCSYRCREYGVFAGRHDAESGGLKLGYAARVSISRNVYRGIVALTTGDDKEYAV